MTNQNVLKRGWMYYQADPKFSLLDKVQGVVRHHESKGRGRVNVCYVHPSALEAFPLAAVNMGRGGGDILADTEAVRVKPDPLVLPDHFLVGVE